MDLTIQSEMRIIRQILHLTQSELASDMGISRTTYIGMEKGNIQLSKTVAIAFVFVIALHIDKLEVDSIEAKLISSYDEKFEKTLNGIIERD